MNKENILKAISIMKRAGNSLYMPEYQLFGADGLAKTEQELHACGNRACFAGYIAVSPEFIKDGGTVDTKRCSMPTIPDNSGEWLIGVHAIEYWLGISETLACSLIFGDRNTHLYFSNFYDKPWVEVNANDVIERLNLILEGKLE